MRLARQTVTQADGMLLAAMEKGESDPVRWSANILSQGNEPRVVKVSKIQFDPGKAPQAGADSFRLDRHQLLFEYQKLARPEESSGFKVQVRLDPVGFLGADTRLASDLWTVGAILALFFAFFGLFQPWVRQDEEGGLRHLTELAASFTQETRAALVQLGGHVRDMVREAQALAGVSSRARGHVGNLRDRVHGGLEEVHQLRLRSKDVLKAGQEAETIALNLVIEATRLGEKGKPLGSMAESLYRFVQQMRKLGDMADGISASLEQQLEPMSLDADQAHHIFEELPQCVSTLDQSVRKSTDALVAQAKIVQSTRVALLGESAGDERKSA